MNCPFLEPLDPEDLDTEEEFIPLLVETGDEWEPDSEEIEDD